MSTEINGYTSKDRNIYAMYDEIMQQISILAQNERFITAINVTVTPEQWIENNQYSNEGYEYCAEVTIEGIDNKWSPDVRLGAVLEADGKIGFATIVSENIVQLFACEGYEENIIIPVIICQKVGV